MSIAILSAGLAACGSGTTSTTVTQGGAQVQKGSGKVKAALILKELTNPYWVAMANSAKKEAAKDGIQLQVYASQSDSDTADQINYINDAVAAGDKGIIIALDGDAVNTALKSAKDAGLLVVAVDTAPTPASVADVTYATNNEAAGALSGKWMALKLAGKSANIALLDYFNNVVLPLDVQRDHGFLKGMGIPVGDPNVNGKEPKSGHYSGGKGGSYTIGCQLPSQASISGGQSAMETCLTKDHNINVVYAINEPAAQGAMKAIQESHTKGITIVTVDGSCSNLPNIADGAIAATASQFPDKMGIDGIKAVAEYAKTGKPVTNPRGQSYVNTGTRLYTNDPQPGLGSLNVTQAKKVCWGAGS